MADSAIFAFGVVVSLLCGAFVIVSAREVHRAQIERDDDPSPRRPAP